MNPDIRSRWVAQEIRVDKIEDLFAATPPLEGKKLLSILAVTKGIGYQDAREHGIKLDFIDVRRASFHADARREVYVQLPEEDHEEGMCGLLHKALYGTRDAPQNWEYSYSEFMTTGMGFQRGRYSSRVFYHPTREMRVVVHGDDFTVLGYEEDLMWSRSGIQNRFECKLRGMLGPGLEDEKSIRILNRVITWSSSGFQYEAVQRHAELIVKGMV